MSGGHEVRGVARGGGDDFLAEPQPTSAGSRSDQDASLAGLFAAAPGERIAVLRTHRRAEYAGARDALAEHLLVVDVSTVAGRVEQTLRDEGDPHVQFLARCRTEPRRRRLRAHARDRPRRLAVVVEGVRGDARDRGAVLVGRLGTAARLAVETRRSRSDVEPIRRD